MADGPFSNEALIARGSRVVLGNYRPLPIVLAGGEGCRVQDVEGNSYLDLVSGIAVSALGYNHPKLVSAVQTQAGKLFHAANIVWNEPQIELAEKLTSKSFAEKVFFCNSGAEANESMLKLARRYFHEKGEARFEFVCMQGSFHGRTMAATTCTGQEKYRLGFEPLLPGVRHVPFGDVAALEQAITERTAAVLIEPIQGEGGVVLPAAGYLRQVRDVCSKHGCLMLLDEVQSGIGRTGSLFAYEQEGFEPDVIALAKGLGGGLPVAAMMTTNAIGEALQPGSHGSTFGGNPVACAAGAVVMDEVSRPEFLAHVTRMGEHLLDRLREMQRTHKRIVADARGRGLWCGLELSVDAANVARMGIKRGVILNVIGGKTIRVSPPLIITQAELDEGLDALDALLVDLGRA